MTKKRFIMEFGTGADLHGGDVNKAATRAVKDAVSRSCLCGLFDMELIKHPDEMFIHLKIAVPYPEQLDKEQVRKSVPFGTVELECVEGGMAVQGLHLQELGAGDQVVIGIAAITVFVNVPK